MTTHDARATPRGRIDVNADLGEGVTDDVALRDVVSSAHGACGYQGAGLLGSGRLPVLGTVDPAWRVRRALEAAGFEVRTC